MIRAKLVSFTGRGAALAERVAAALPDARCERYARTVDPSLHGTRLSRFAQQAMVDCDLIVFIGAAGIAVRAIAPYLAGKAFDPAVLVLDENGKFVISLISGHLGGANALAERLAGALGAQPVITTATDGRGVFAVDTWAKAQGCVVYDTPGIKFVSGALLRNDPVGLASDFPVDGILPALVRLNGACEAGFTVGFDVTAQPFPHTLHLVPRIVSLGLGCRRGTTRETIERVVFETLRAAGVPMEGVRVAASIDRKADEAGLLAFCAAHGLEFVTYPAQTLEAAAGDFTPSAFVQKTVGVDNVCERAAVCAADGGRLICRKTARDGVTVALAIPDWRVRF